MILKYSLSLSLKFTFSDSCLINSLLIIFSIMQKVKSMYKWDEFLNFKLKVASFKNIYIFQKKLCKKTVEDFYKLLLRINTTFWSKKLCLFIYLFFLIKNNKLCFYPNFLKLLSRSCQSWVFCIYTDIKINFAFWYQLI